MPFEDLSVVSNMELEDESKSYKKLVYFIPLEQKPFNEFSGSFSIPLSDSEFCVSSNHILMGNKLAFKIFKYDQNMTLKLKSSHEFQFANFMIRKLPKDGRILIYKIILALYEQNVSVDCAVFARSTDADKDSELKKYCVKSGGRTEINKKSRETRLDATLLELLISFLNLDEVTKVKFNQNFVQITYRNGLNKIFDSHMNKVEKNLEFADDRIKISKNKIEVFNSGSVIYEKKMKEVRQEEITESTIFVLMKHEIFVGKFLH